MLRVQGRSHHLLVLWRNRGRPNHRFVDCQLRICAIVTCEERESRQSQGARSFCNRSARYSSYNLTGIALWGLARLRPCKCHRVDTIYSIRSVVVKRMSVCTTGQSIKVTKDVNCAGGATRPEVTAKVNHEISLGTRQLPARGHRPSSQNSPSRGFKFSEMTLKP